MRNRKRGIDPVLVDCLCGRNQDIENSFSLSRHVFVALTGGVLYLSASSDSTVRIGLGSGSGAFLTGVPWV